MNEEEVLFSKDDARDISVILLMRLYDIQMSQFMIAHPEEAEKLYNLHCEGGFLNPTPAYSQDKIVGY